MSSNEGLKAIDDDLKSIYFMYFTKLHFIVEN